MLMPVREMSLYELAQEIKARLKRSIGANRKLGTVYSWSITAAESCPGKTAHCFGKCFARRMQAFRKTVRLGWARCFQIARHVLFGDALLLALKSLPPGQIRIHVSGDFFSVGYLNAWIRALKGAPQLAPFAFTRSWRVPAIKAAIKAADWPTWILASTDPETGPCPPQMREAAMVETSKKAVLAGKSTAPKLACPEQTGKSDSCATCGRCPMAQLRDGALIPIQAASKVGVTFLVH